MRASSTPRGQTNYDEFYAQCLLQRLYPSLYGGLINADKPDLQDKAIGLGVEVTRLAIGEMEELRNAEKKMRKYFCVDIPRDTHLRDMLIKTINSKLDKLNKHTETGSLYEEMATYQLYIHAECEVSEGILKSALSEIHKHSGENNRTFDKIIIFDGLSIIECGSPEWNIRGQAIAQDDLSFVKSQTIQRCRC